MSEESVKRKASTFYRRRIGIYGRKYLNKRLARWELDDIGGKDKKKWLPGCVWGVDCCKLRWKNYPKSPKRQLFNPKGGNPAVISVEACCDNDLYVWQWFKLEPRMTSLW